jgi:hypothetical protein
MSGWRVNKPWLLPDDQARDSWLNTGMDMADNDDHETYVVKGTFMRGHAINGQQLLFSLHFASARRIAMLYDHTCNDSAMRSYVSGAFKPSPMRRFPSYMHHLQISHMDSGYEDLTSNTVSNVDKYNLDMAVGKF